MFRVTMVLIGLGAALAPKQSQALTVVDFHADGVIQEGDAYDVVNVWDNANVIMMGGVVTTVYEFVPELNTLTQVGGRSGAAHTYQVEGTFILAVDYDAHIVAFEEVNATYGQGWSLGDLLNMTGLQGTLESPTGIVFVGETADGFGTVVSLTLDLEGSLLSISGGYTDQFPDGYSNTLVGVAKPVPEPAAGIFLAARRRCESGTRRVWL